jgi:hypothetical protein
LLKIYFATDEDGDGEQEQALVLTVVLRIPFIPSLNVSC